VCYLFFLKGVGDNRCDLVYSSSVFQQAISAVSVDSESPVPFYDGTLADDIDTDNDCYELDTGCFAVYGFEYKPGFDTDNGVRPP
jgi:hypothetical protein